MLADLAASTDRFHRQNTAQNLVVRFRHLHPLAARSRANAGITGTTSNNTILVEPLNLTFEREFAARGTQMSNSLH